MSDNFNARITKILINEEAPLNYIYPDPVGIPTIGCGYALLVKNQEGIYKMRSFEEINDTLRKVTGKDNIITPEAYNNLKKVINILNNNDIEKNKRIKNAQKYINDNNPNVTLTDDQINKLILQETDKARNRIIAEIRERAANKDWSKDKTDKFIELKKNSDEMVGLTSVKYNMGEKMPKTIDAWLDGNKAAMYYEIMYNTNGGYNDHIKKGIANRRAAEAELVKGDTSEYSDKDWNNWREIMLRNNEKIKTYERKYEDAFKQKSSMKDIYNSRQTNAAKDINAAPAQDNSMKIVPPRKPVEKAAKSPAYIPHKPKSIGDSRLLSSLDEDTKREIEKDDPAYKRPEQLTEAETFELRKRSFNMPSHAPEADRINKKIDDAFNLRYKSKVKRDETGKSVDGVASPPFPEVTETAKSADGNNLLDGFISIAQELDKNENTKEGVLKLQKGLNKVTAERSYFADPLVEDGVFGIKTAGALKRALSDFGESEVLKYFRN